MLAIAAGAAAVGYPAVELGLLIVEAADSEPRRSRAQLQEAEKAVDESRIRGVLYLCRIFLYIYIIGI